MRIRMLTLMAGPEGIRSPGSVVDLPPADAYALVEGGFAVFAESPAKAVAAAQVVESATAAPVREATTGLGQRRRGPK